MTGRRSPCPVACTLDLIGDKWTLLVVRDLLLGRAHFKEFCDSPDRTATNILADRLERLLRHGIVEKQPSPVYPGRECYRLTPKGKSLRPVINTVMKWGLEHLEGTEARLTPK